jgi:hypothetical protein
MKKTSLFILALLLATSSAFAQSLILGRNIFPEGTFDIFGESRLYPNGWKFPDPNDKPWTAGFRADVVKGEAGTKELRIVNPDTVGFTGVTGTLVLPPKIDRLRITYRILPKSLEFGAPDPAGNGAGIYARFYDKDTKGVLGGWVGGGPVKSTDTEWQDKETIFTVPPSAVSLELQVALRSAKGEIRVDDIEVVPVGMSD